MSANRKPAAALPWIASGETTDDGEVDVLTPVSGDPEWPWYVATTWGFASSGDTPGIKAGRQNAEYIVHAANAYPKLIEFVRKVAQYRALLGADAEQLLRDLGEL